MKRIAVAFALVLLAACGGGDSKAADRVIEIEMRDIEYAPATIDVKAGELVELRFRNVGKLTHDAFIGTGAQQREHEAEMAEGDGGHDHGGGGDAVTVKAGKTESLRYTFDKDDDGIIIGCHEPGHYASGMRVTVNVS